MTSLTKLMVLLLLAVYTVGQCSLGCLACEKTSNVTFKCSVCDLYNHYAVDYKGICTKQEIPNCELPSADRTRNFCLKCKAGFVLDKEIETCVVIPEINKVEKCVRYLALNHCSECESGFYIKEGVCVAIETQLEGCGSYTTDGTKCTRCLAGFVLKSESCQKFYQTSNCLVYSMSACDTCETGFFREMNYYSTLDLNPSRAESIIVENKVEEGTVKPPVPTVCHKHSIAKCAKYLNFKECDQCEANYYVDRDRNCTKNPYNKIPYCYRYKDKVTCIECEMTHYLASNECVKRTMVSNCKKYKTNSSVCIECEAPFYIDVNTCKLRAFSRMIEFCTQNHLSMDECLVCKKRFMLTQDKRACLLEIPMCETYNSASTFSISHFVCDTCRPGYYPSENRDECNPQDVVNCKEYLLNSPKCSLCDPSFFYRAEDNYCQRYTATGCLTRMPAADKCETCLVGFYKTADSECLPYTISNCKTEKPDADECQTCEENHFNSGGNCFKYNLIGCETPKADKNECTICISGYYLKNNLCWKNNLNGCKHASKTENECEQCEPGFYLKDKRCLKHTVLNCDLFKPDSNQCFSNGCSTGYIHSNGFCFKGYRPNCDEIDPANGNCKTDGCKDGYYLSSGHCLKQNRPKCVEYSSNNTCTKCESGYYAKTGACWEQYQEGCIEFKSDTTIECSKCREGYYLKTEMCLPYTISNCETPAPGSDSCAKCLTGFNKDPTTGNCYIFDVPYCKTPDAASSPPACTTCHIGYVKIEGKCYLGTSVDNCYELDVEPEKCIVCEDGYYPNSGVCTAQDPATLHSGNCVIFKVNSDDCKVCKSGFHGTGCSAVTNMTNCLFSDGMNDSCSLCKSGFKDTSNCGAVGGARPLDPNCGGNSTTTDDSCSICNAGFTYMSGITNVYVEFSNCALNTSDGCQQCDPGYQLNADKKCDKASGNMACLKKVATDVTPLSAATACVVCPNNAKIYLDTAECKTRTVLYDNCVGYTANSNADAATLCTACAEDTAMPGWENYSFCIDNFDPTNAAATIPSDVSSCETIAIGSVGSATATCNNCKAGTVVQTNSLCAAPTAGKFFYEGMWAHDSMGRFTNTETANAGTIKFLHSAVKQDQTVTFVGCQPGYLRAITIESLTGDGDFTLTNKNRTYIHSETGQLLNNPFMVIPDMCVQTTTFSSFSKILDPADNAVKVDAFTAPMFNNCDLAYSEGLSGPICLKCKIGYNGERVLIAGGSDGNAIDVPVGLNCLELNTDFEKRYTGASFVDPDIEKILIEDQLQYDSCKDGRTLVVFMEIVTTNQVVWSKTFVTGTQKAPSMTCVDDIPDTIFIENCGFYAIKGDEDPKTSTDASYFCASCQPGFKATVSSNKVTSCDYIKNCDISDPKRNTWMNQCQTCIEGSTWEADATNKNPIWDACLRTVDPNCWLVKTGGNYDECFICKKGYNVSASLKCIPINHAKNNCAVFGREATAFTNNHTDAALPNSPTFEYSRVAAALELRFVGYKSSTVGCRVCNTNYLSFVGSAMSALKACVSDFEIFMDPVANCKNHVGNYSSTTTTCAVCQDGYALKNDKTACVKNSNLLGACVSLDSSDVCSACQEGHQLHEDTSVKYCRPVGNCLQFAAVSTGETQCVQCREYFRPVSTTSKDCIAIEPEDPCMDYDGPKCIKCKNGGAPVNFVGVYSPNALACTTYPHSQEPFSKMPLKIAAAGLQLVDMSTGNRNFIQITNATFPTEVCFPKVEVAHCLTMGNIECEECQPGYALAHPLQCVAGGIANCLMYGPTGYCTKCNLGYYADSDGACVARTLENCLKPDEGGQNCMICDVGYYLDSSNNKRCLLRTNITCEEYVRETDECFKCRAGYYLDGSNGKCVLQSHPGCLFGNLNSNDCRVCNKGYYLSSGTCTEYSFGDCEIYSPVEDKCFICSEKFYADANRKCVVRTKLNCELPSFDEDKCISCEAGYYLTDDICTLYTVDGCDVYHPYENTCQTCLKGLYFEQSTGKCVANPDPNCEEMNPYLNLCVRCITTAYLDVTSGVCSNYSVNCEYYNPYADKCLECPLTHYLDNGECKSYTIKNCLETKRFEDKCASCIPGFYFSQQGVCSAITVQNCDIPSLRENKCVQCSSGFYNQKGVCRQYLVRFCQRADPTQDQCMICKEGYYLKIDGTCALYTKKGCLGYIPNKDRCASCRGGFYMQDGTCGAYTVDHCRLHDPFEDACLTCKTGYFINGSECTKFTVQNCATWSENSDRCKTCKKDFYLEGFDCKPYTIKNCLEFHPKADMCVKCSKDNYFRNGLGMCQLSTLVPYCSVYAEYLDECVTCMIGYFLEEKKCLVNPQGVYRCKEYLDETHCYRCEVPYYLRDNQCLLSDTLVTDCSLYSHDGICAVCIADRILIGNECKVYTNSTCATWSSPENCLTCPFGKLLDTSKSTTTCEDIGIAGCSVAVFSPDGKHQCSKCIASYFLFENKCTESTSVPNCVEYATETLCDKCLTGHILSADKKTCTAIAVSVGTNCSVGRHMLQPECSVCKEGYYFDSKGTCVSCLVMGCALCDVINLRKCRLCKSGYQMTELFYCETINAIEDGSLGDQNNLRVVDEQLGTDSGWIEGVARSALGVVSVALLLFVRKLA